MVTSSAFLIILAAQLVAQTPQMVVRDLGPTKTALATLNKAIVAATHAPNPTVRRFGQSISKSFQVVRDAAADDVLPEEYLTKLNADARILTMASQIFQDDARMLVDLREVDNDLKIKADALAIQVGPISLKTPLEPLSSRPAAPLAANDAEDALEAVDRALDRQVLAASVRRSVGNERSASGAVDILNRGGVGPALDIAALKFPDLPAKASPRLAVQVTQWERPVTIITKLHGQPRPDLDVWYIARGFVFGGVASHNMRWLAKSQVEKLPLPWGSYLVYATAGPLPPVISENQLTRLEVKLYPNIADQVPLRFEVDAR